MQPLARTVGAAAAAATMALASAARADSDTYYCIGDDYLAMELRQWNMRTSTHLVRVVRFGGRHGIERPVDVQLPDFQVHGMKCGRTDLAMFGWDRKFVVDLAIRPPVVAQAESSDRGASTKQGFETAGTGYDPRLHDYGSLGYAQSSRVIDITSRDGYRYDLRIRYRERPHVTPGKGGIVYHDVTASLRQLDGHGRTVREQRLYRGTREETID